ATVPAGRGDDAQTSLRTPSEPDPAVSPPPGMPNVTGNELLDKQTFTQWAGDMTTLVRTNEDRAANTIIPIARKCR
ncbi:MAG: hypothetical protein JO103_12150, partial [Candidatus Eremiobacteraeota bacterium]|nr:hypothetical protein [Candidatus Eremiobacteraeota bacterium]